MGKSWISFHARRVAHGRHSRPRPNAAQMHYTRIMKTATIPSIRVRPELRIEIEAVLNDDESLSEFVESSVIESVRRRRNHAEFLARGMASLASAKLAGNYVDSDVVVNKLERKLIVAKSGRSKVKA